MRASLVASLLSAIVLVLLTALTGNSDAVDARNIQDQAAIPASPFLPASGQAVGQSFTAHSARLHAIELRFIVSEDFEPAPADRLTLHLRDQNEGGVDVATSSIFLSALRNNEYSKFTFSPIEDSANRSFFFSLSCNAADLQRGYFTLWASDVEAYPEGRMFLNGAPTDRDVVFRTYYEPDLRILGAALASAWERYGWALMVILGLLSIGVLLATGGSIELLASAGGLSLGALSAVSILLFFFHWTDVFLLMLLLPLFAIAAFRWVRGFRHTRRALPEILLLAPLAAVALGMGLVQIRDTPVPLWVDSLTHARLIQSLLDSGQLPASYFYHLGFHAVTALVVQIAHITVPAAMLLMGPLLITQTGLSIFLLSRRLSGSLVAGLASAIGVWFLSPTPSYLTTWGRYPLLMAGALLPLALLSFIDWLDAERADGRRGLVAALLLMGLAFTQVRLVVFWLVFAIVYAVLAYKRSRRRDLALRLAALLGVGLSFALIWLVILLTRGLSWETLLAENAAAPSNSLSGTLAVLSSHHGPELIFLGLVSALAGILARRKTVVLMLLWYAVLGLLAGLPYSASSGAFLPPDLVLLMGFVPLSILIGDGAAWISTRWSIGGDRRQVLVWGLATLLIVFLGVRDNSSIVNPATVQFTDSDSQAMTWIREHSTPQATYLINSFNWYSSVYMPADGGAWIPWLAGQPARLVGADSVPVTENLSLLDQWIAAQHIDHVYLGGRGGVLSRALFACRPQRYALVYQQDGIEIYAVVPLDLQELPGIRQEGCDMVG